jgi:TonB-dependent receptor
MPSSSPPIRQAPAQLSHLIVTALVFSLAMTFPAMAREGAAPTFVITGQAYATERALQDQVVADNVISVVRADGIGQLSDRNLAEALQRLPGISIARDQGEGSYVSIRGLVSELNAVTLNGNLLPSPERDGRAVMLDVLPSSLVRALVVSKTVTPDQDANSLGGTVDVQIVSAFDHPDRFLRVEAGGGHETSTRRTTPNAAFVWSDRLLDGKLGVATGLSFARRKFSSGNIETGGAWEGNALEEFEHRDYRITRERRGLALNVEFRPADDTQYYARLVDSRFDDDEQRQAHVIEFDEAQLAGVPGHAESMRELKVRKESQSIRSLGLGTFQRFGDWSLHLAAGVTRSAEDTPRHLAEGQFVAQDTFGDIAFTDGRRPRLVSPAALNRAELYVLSEIELVRTLFIDHERNLRFDLGRSLELAGVATELKIGAKTSRRTKIAEETTWKLEHFADAPFSLSAAQLGLANFSTGPAAYAFGPFGPALDAAPMLALARGHNLDSFVDQQKSAVSNFHSQERIDAAYLQIGLFLAKTRLLAGLRTEGTRQRTEGTSSDNGTFAPAFVERQYGHWLPSLHLRHDLDNLTSLRAAWTNTVVRPTFSQLAPGHVIAGAEAAFGNPGLKPLQSANFDLGIERRLGYASVLSAYVFHKRIRDFIYQTDLAGSAQWANFEEAVTLANGDRASVTGLELGGTKAFRELPRPWQGLFLSANVTLSTSQATSGRFDVQAGAIHRRNIPLPSQASRVLNLVLGYETAAFGLRLAANHQSRYLQEIGDQMDASHDLYVDAQLQVDLSVRYSISPRCSLVFEAMNLSDSPCYVYTGVPSRNAQYESYGRTYRINLNFVL